ncbi:MAG: LPS export ABC transporter periplasmic protein LptC [Bacteroidaceae bacterium]|nr:LPS export ABC transporter periplasmic protein LptC [Bacteroidaceae bacterium]
MIKSAKVVLNRISSITIAFCAVVMLLLFTSCSHQSKVFGEAVTERDSLPVLATYDVNTLISDSGLIRYRIEADEWLVYDRKNPSYWAFEKGVYLEKFDEDFVVDADIKADTAYYYDKDRLWELRGDVAIKNLKGERFNTELLFWDEKTQKVYSDKFIRIEQEDKIVTGEGFESNQQMTDYTIFKPGGVFYINEEMQADSTAVDSLTTDTLE